MIGEALGRMIEDLAIIKDYNNKLEKKYLLLSAVVADLLELDGDESDSISIIEVIDKLYDKFDKPVPEAIVELKKQM